MTGSMALALAETTPALEAWQPSEVAVGLPYVELGELASTISALDRQAPQDWMVLFAEVERQMVEDPARQELLTVGFLEALQNVELSHGRDLARWEPLLGLQTLAAWRELINLWANGPRGSRDIRRR